MKSLSIIALMVLLSLGLNTQNTDRFLSAMNRADAAAISAFVSTTTNLQIEQLRSRACNKEAERMLSNFFENNPNPRFEFRHSGSRNSRNGTFYKIGSLTSKGNKYRVFVLFSNLDNRLVIEELSIERE